MRLASAPEAGLVREISADAYVPAYRSVIGVVPRPAHEDYSQRIADGQVWLHEIGSDSAGLIVLEPKPDHLLVYSVAVRPAHQRRGLGRDLLIFAQTEAARIGLPELRLYTNVRMVANIRFYEACGFRPLGTRPHPSRQGERLLDMAKHAESR